MRVVNMTFVQGLMNAMSKMFVQRAMKIERELLPIMRANNSDVVAIRVHRFRNGRNATHMMMSNNTVIINFIIILKDNATRDNNTAFRFRQALRNAIDRRNFTTLSADVNFNVTIKGQLS